MDPNQETEQVTHSPLMASSPTTASGTLPPYFRLNYLPSILASLIFLFFPLHLNFPFFPIPSPSSKRYRTLIYLTLLCSAYSSSFTLCPRPHPHAPFSGSQGTSISLTDLAAKQSLLFTKITDPSLSPAYNLKTYYRSFITLWHNAWHTLPLTKLRSIKKPQFHDPLQTVHLAMKK